MTFSLDELDNSAFIVVAIILIALTSAQMSYRLTPHLSPFAHNPFILLLFLLVLILYIFLSNKVAKIALLVIFIFTFGIYERLLHVLDPTIYSDVLLVTEEAIQVILSGGNIYLHSFRNSVPPGQSFKYGPFEPIFYIPFYFIFGNLEIAEFISSIITMFLIFLLGRYVGYIRTLIPLALYSSWGIIIENTGAGVNDDSSGMLAFLSIFLLIISINRCSRKIAGISAIIFGISICFKLFPALLLPFIVLLLFNLNKKSPIDWKFYFTLVFITIFSLSLPYLIHSPIEYLDNIFVENSNRLVVFLFQWHIWSSLLNRSFLIYLPEILNIKLTAMIPFLPKIMLSIFIVAMILLIYAAKRNTSLAKGIAFGIIAWFILLISGPWFPSSFFSFIAPFICTLPIIDLAICDNNLALRIKNIG